MNKDHRVEAVFRVMEERYPEIADMLWEGDAKAVIAAADNAAWESIEQCDPGAMGLIYGGVIIDPSDGPVGPHHISMGWLTDGGWKIDGGLFVSGPEKFRHITSPQEGT